MNAKRSLTWLVDGVAFRLAPLDHQDLDELYRGRLLPMAGSLRVSIEKFIQGGGRDESLVVEDLEQCLESLRAILEASLRKAHPWMTEPEAECLVAMYCRDEDNSTDDVLFYRQVQRLGKSTLDGLVSQHRGRLAALVSLAEQFEALVTIP
ncbi:hypothetical protein ACYOEI_01635 [Singulisphaera rosea]